MLALISGSGDLPRVLYEALDPKPHVAALEGFPPEGIPHDRTFRLETIGGLIADLKARGVDAVCFAGSIRRPPVDPGRIDAETQPLVPRIMAALEQGDDAALRIILGFFEEAGIAIRAAHDILPTLVPKPGVPTRKQPDERARADVTRAVQVVGAMGAADLGQSCIVCNGQVLAAESVMGTDWMLQVIGFCRAAHPEMAWTGADWSVLPGGDTLGAILSNSAGRPLAEAIGIPDPIRSGGLLYKAPKPGQDLRVDMPVIGPETLRLAAAAALDGIVVEAGRVMVLDREATVKQADELDLFLWFRD